MIGHLVSLIVAALVSVLPMSMPTGVAGGRCSVISERTVCVWQVRR